MWKILERSIPLYVKFNQEDEFKIFLMDFIHIWSTSFTKSDFLSCLKKSNATLEFDDDNKLLERGINMFSEPEKLKSEVKIDDDKSTMSISLFMFLGEFKFKLEGCKLKKQNEEYYFQHVTQPLLKTVKDLRTNQNILRNLLIDKDKEISKYRVQNVDILYSGKTDKFDDDVYSSQHNVYETNFGQSDIPDVILEKIIQAPKTVSVKLENQSGEMNIKTEPASNSEDHLTFKARKEQKPIKMETLRNENVSMAKRKKKGLNY
ncbi:hypothetical protein K1T71_005651 [Dendrolimus kikuchii]|uniref:Uncharacterized protein n=1 Tax=Dendrolimus kikuchii TaxID=765133 RepID=A0ACC1D4I2_9NEOP|nr:hypothetical protein K1T71_005651 [Dendrolimus kikuchii]